MLPLRPQTNYQLAFELGLERARGQSAASLEALGAEKAGDDAYRLRVLDATCLVDLNGGTVTRVGTEGEQGGRARQGESPRRSGAAAVSAGGPAFPMSWQILGLHYLCASPPWPDSSHWVSFAHFPDARGYDSVYQGRVLNRLCATAGRDRNTFVQACHRVGAESVDWGDEGFEFRVFPQLPVAITWYYGDDEFPPNASFFYLDNILSFLPVEDVIVLSEGLVGRLQGKSW